jgi:hypothetical protein
MRVQRIVYGADKESDAGWRVLLRNRGILKEDEAFFIKLCESLPLPKTPRVHDRVYFGAARKRRRFLCCGDYVGKDRFGREGAWQFQGFIAPRVTRSLPPHMATQQLLTLSKTGSETELDLDEAMLPTPCNPPEGFPRLLSQQRPLALVASADDWESVGTVLDRLQVTSGQAPLKYVYPAEREEPCFDVVGLPFEEARKENGVIAKAKVDTSKRRWQLAAVLLGICALAGVLFGAWGCAGWQSSRRSEERHRRRVAGLEKQMSQLQERSARLKRIRSELDTEFQEVLEKGQSGNVRRFIVKIGATNYEFRKTESQSILAELSGILRLIDSSPVAPGPADDKQADQARQGTP